MHQSDRVKLLFGPRFRYGQRVFCAVRGEVVITGLSNSRIPWPTCSVHSSRPLIVYGALAKAIRRESVEAIKHWFGVGQDTVWRWRKALDVDPITEGTSALLSRWAPETIQSKEAIEKRMPALKTPERAAKIAAAKRGKPRPRHIIEAIRRANLGRRASKETREKMGQAALDRGAYPPAAGVPWAAEEDALLGTMKDRDVAERTGRSEEAVSSRRYVLGLAAFTKRTSRGEPAKWTPAKERLLGTMANTDLEGRGRSNPCAANARRRASSWERSSRDTLLHRC